MCLAPTERDLKNPDNYLLGEKKGEKNWKGRLRATDASEQAPKTALPKPRQPAPGTRERGMEEKGVKRPKIRKLPSGHDSIGAENSPSENERKSTKAREGSGTCLVDPLELSGKWSVLAVERNRRVLAEDAVDGGRLSPHRQDAPPALHVRERRRPAERRVERRRLDVHEILHHAVHVRAPPSAFFARQDQEPDSV